MTQPQDTVEAPFEAIDEEGGTDRKRLAALGVVAALLLGGGGYVLLSGGSDLEPLPPVKRAVKPAAAPIAGKPVVLPPVSSVKLGRDPFRPLYVVPVAAPAAPADPATGGTGTTGGTAGKPATPAEPAKPAAPANYALRLSRVDGTGSDLTAKFLIGQAGKIQFARAGSVFGRTAEIRLLSIQKGSGGSGTAVIQVGDGSPFDISTGDAAIFVP